jgi:hypothetical protein
VASQSPLKARTGTMITPIYKTTKATKAKAAIEYVAGFEKATPFAFIPALTALIFDESDAGKVARKSLKTALKAAKPTVYKGLAFILTLQGKGVELSRSERKSLFAAMRITEERTGLSNEELVSLAA